MIIVCGCLPFINVFYNSLEHNFKYRVNTSLKPYMLFIDALYIIFHLKQIPRKIYLYPTYHIVIKRNVSYAKSITNSCLLI